MVEPDTGVCSGERRVVKHDRERRRGVQALFLLLASLVGTVVPIQVAVKSELRETVGRTKRLRRSPSSWARSSLAAVLLVHKQGRPGSLRRHRGAVMSLARGYSASSTLPRRYLWPQARGGEYRGVRRRQSGARLDNCRPVRPLKPAGSSHVPGEARWCRTRDSRCLRRPAHLTTPWRTPEFTLPFSS